MKEQAFVGAGLPAKASVLPPKLRWQASSYRRACAPTFGLAFCILRTINEGTGFCRRWLASEGVLPAAKASLASQLLQEGVHTNLRVGVLHFGVDEVAFVGAGLPAKASVLPPKASLASQLLQEGVHANLRVGVLHSADHH
ncbi:hypothetical protein AEQ67_21340 [Pseudomonas sp. RIT-PI-q]|nr:hypothetical protein AEQ67_21340 [Pseudomonas sp. RIT-PI-q]